MKRGCRLLRVLYEFFGSKNFRMLSEHDIKMHCRPFSHFSMCFSHVIDSSGGNSLFINTD